MEKLSGEWKIESERDIDKYMAALGMSRINQIIARNIKPNIKIEINDKKIKVSCKGVFKFPVEGILNEDFIEKTPDGRTTKSCFTWVNNQLVLTQKWGDRISTITRHIVDENHLVATYIIDGVCAIVHYTRV